MLLLLTLVAGLAFADEPPPQPPEGEQAAPIEDAVDIAAEVQPLYGVSCSALTTPVIGGRLGRIKDDGLPVALAPRTLQELIHVTGGTSRLSAQGAVIFLDDTALIAHPLLQGILPSTPVLGGVGAVSGGWGGVPR